MLTSEKVTADELARLALFEGESADALEWIAGNMEVHRYAAGEVTVNPGDEVKHLSILLEGEVHYQFPNSFSGAFVRTAGQAMGVLPFSRMKTAPSRGLAIHDARIAALASTHFRELVYRAPVVAQRLVSEMTDRTRETTRIQEGSNKLLALGKLSAGLAHELNNPASAAVRSSARLRELLVRRREYGLAMRAEAIPERAREIMTEISNKMSTCTDLPAALDPLERADREGDLADWLDSIGGPSELASELVDAGITQEALAPLQGIAAPRLLELGLRILVSDHEMECLTRELEEASRRISELVQAVKSYSYMDQVPVTEIDVTQGIENTLRMFQHQLKHGFKLVRNFAPDMPRIPCNGSALNQIWTNLIDNALQAMEQNPPGQPRVLEIKTCVEPESILVEVSDTGPGIPKEIQSQVFDPFFTTKAVGEGTGLGLDMVQRIVRNHNGSIRVTSEPGHTVFQVRLPR